MAAIKRATKKALVLIIEDNPAQQHLYKVIADELNIIPCIVGNCSEAIAYSEFLHFDLILMDVELPDLDGFQCAKAIQKKELERGRRAPMVAVTAHAMIGDRERYLEAGMDDYLSKPFALQELKDKIAIWAVAPE